MRYDNAVMRHATGSKSSFTEPHKLIGLPRACACRGVCFVMTEPIAEPSDCEGLWSFSLKFYAHAGVAEALIALQDRDNVDVNLILFALWLGISGRAGLTGAGLAAADEAVRTIRAEIVAPLRALRRKL